MTILDRGPHNTGYHERSRKMYKQDYKMAIDKLNTWISSGEPWDSRPLFKEVRDGHIEAIRQLGLDRKYDVDDFLNTKERQRSRWRKRYRDTVDGTVSVGKKEETSRLLDASVNANICFGCGEIIRGKYLNPDPPAPKLKVHPNKDCQKQARGRYEILVG